MALPVTPCTGVEPAVLRPSRRIPRVRREPGAAVARQGLRAAGPMTANVPGPERTVRELMPVLSLCDQVDLWCYGRSAGLDVF